MGNFRRLSVLGLTALTLFSCGNKSIPQKGYDKFKEKVNNIAKPYGLKINWLSCGYAWIKNTPSAYAELKDTVWYCIRSSIEGQQALDYVLYESKYDSVFDGQSPDSYINAVSICSDPLYGETGTL